MADDESLIETRWTVIVTDGAGIMLDGLLTFTRPRLAFLLCPLCA